MAKKTKDYVINLKDLLDAGCHFGHQSKRWNPKMEEYIFQKRGGVHIFDLEITARKLKEAMEFARDLTAQGKTIVFVGSKRQAAAIVKEEAEKCGMPYVAERWLGGTITNWEEIKKRIDRLMDLEKKKEAGELKKYTKKENVLITREIEKLKRFFGGLVKLKGKPDALFIVDVRKEIAAVKEAKRKEVAVIGMVDSNADPDMIDYVIPVNDDAVRSIKLIVSKLAEAVNDGMGLKGKTPVKKEDKKKKE